MDTTYITIEQAKKDGNSQVNQSIKSDFVNRNIYANVGGMVEYILTQSVEDANAPFSYDDVENLHSIDKDDAIEIILDDYESNEDEFIEYANNPETFNRRCKNKGDFEVFLNSLELDEIKELADNFSISLDEQQDEVYEWWMVSGFLLDKLKEKGEAVIDSEGIWGRQSTGQSILLDYVITEICAEMGILSGQENSWENK